MTDMRNTGAELLDKIINRIADGDKSALADFYSAVSEQVYGVSLSILRNRQDAEDVIHELLLEVWRCAPTYHSMGKPMAWVVTIARNLCKMKLRERSKLSDTPFDDLLGLIEDTSGLSVEDRTTIRACIEILSEPEREVVILHAVAGLKHREIAKILGQPLSTVISRYRTAIKKLSIELKGAL